ncbi:MAG: hypothetical protein R3Y12_05595 [Clostridia bacterium]
MENAIFIFSNGILLYLVVGGTILALFLTLVIKCIENFSRKFNKRNTVTYTYKSCV